MPDEKKQSSYKKLFSNTIVFAVGSFSSKILVLLLIPIYTNYLTTSELGITDVLTQIANWIIPLATLTISEAIIRFGLDKAYDKRQVFTIGNIICGIGLAIFAIVLPIVSLTGLADKYIGGYAIILFFYVFMSSLKTMYSTFVRAMEKVKLFAFNGILTTFLTLFWTALFFMILPKTMFGANSGILKYMLATILSDFLSVVFLTFSAKLWRYIHIGRIDHEMLHTMLQYSIPLIPAQLLWLITNSSDSFMTTHYLGAEYNGILSAAYKIPNIVATVYMMFGQAWNMSAITENDSEDRDKFYENVFDFNQGLLYILAAGCLLIIQPLTNIMIGPAFRSCVQYSPILIYSTIFSCFTTFMGSIYLASRKTKRSLFTSLVSGVINIGLNVILIPRIGLFGPAISTVSAYVTVFFIRAYDSRKLVPFHINYKRMIVSNLLILTMLGICLKQTNLASVPVLYLVVFILFVAVFMINKKSVDSIFSRLLPKRIYEKLNSINTLQLGLAVCSSAVMLLWAYRKSGILFLGIVAVMLILMFIRRENLSCFMYALAFWAALSMAYGFTIGFIMLMIYGAVLILLKNQHDGIIGIILLDLCLIPKISVNGAIFVIAVEALVLIFIFRKNIIEKCKNWANGTWNKK